jgi:thymidylate synthase (FAD)
MRIIKPSFEFFPSGMHPYAKIEKSGRTCYQSFDKITDDSHDKFIKMILKRKHYAVLEHAQIMIKVSSVVKNMFINSCDPQDKKYLVIGELSLRTPGIIIISGNVRAWIEFFDKIKIKSPHLYSGLLQAFRIEYPIFFGEPEENVFPQPNPQAFIQVHELLPSEIEQHYRPTARIIADRGFLAEITRHREASFSVESTRYCSYNQEKFGSEITVIEPLFYHQKRSVFWNPYKEWKQSCERAEKAYFRLLKGGSTAQEARTILPNSLKTEIVITANIDEWRHIFDLRCDTAAHPQMREIMIPMKEQFDVLYSKSFV